MSTNAVLRSFETVALSLNWGSLSPTVSMERFLRWVVGKMMAANPGKHVAAVWSHCCVAQSMYQVDCSYDVNRCRLSAVNLRDLRYLVALADHAHFGRAAAACF